MEALYGKGHIYNRSHSISARGASRRAMVDTARNDTVRGPSMVVYPKPFQLYCVCHSNMAMCTLVVRFVDFDSGNEGRSKR